MRIYHRNILSYLRDLKRPCPGRKIRCERKVMVPTFDHSFLFTLHGTQISCGWDPSHSYHPRKDKLQT